MHVILRSSQATGERSFLLKARAVEKILRTQAAHFGVRLYDAANSGNHVHMLLRTPSRVALARFLRSVSGLIARLMLNAERGRASKMETSFWDQRPYSRIVSWGPEYKNVRRYLGLNRLENTGIDRTSARHMMAQIDRLWLRAGNPAPS